ncbi:MAG TPA: stage II sporulation protein M [Rhizomicrobium sp.]|jgi:uncharacterized membrane protein SpoIIM required for sporulation
MEAPDLKSHRFRAEREADWQRLETLLTLFERGRSSRLSDDDVVAIPVLYRSALSSLSAARAVSLDQNLIAYLETLCTRAYFCVYGTRSTIRERFARFFTQDWRAAVQMLWRETILAAALGLVGAVVGFVLVMTSSDWFYAFISEGMAEGRDPGASAKFLRESLHDNHGAQGLTVFAGFLFTHNAQVAMMAFALGFACGLPTAYLLLTNGLMLGALWAVYAQHGLAVDFGGWILIHGFTELFAITLAGAAGFRIGWALAFPGEKTRLDALTAAGRLAAIVMVGVVLMLAVAGLLEGYARQLISDTVIRYSVSGATALIWLSFFYARDRRLTEPEPTQAAP